MKHEPSENFIRLAHGSEGCKLKAYRDAGGIWTIGWGHTGKDVKPEMVITQQRANELFFIDCKVHINFLNAKDFNIGQPQFDALLDLIYNIGPGNFNKDIFLIKAIKANSQAGIRAGFMRHIYDHTGKKEDGLVKRRQNELNLYF